MAQTENKEQREFREVVRNALFQKSVNKEGLGALFLSMEDYSDGFKDGVKWAFAKIQRQIAISTAARFEPTLHILDFIDKTLGKK